jgi:hypothetical protein
VIEENTLAFIAIKTLLFNAQSVLVGKLNFLPTQMRTRSGSETVFCLLCDLNL